MASKALYEVAEACPRQKVAEGDAVSVRAKRAVPRSLSGPDCRRRGDEWRHEQVRPDAAKED